MPGIITHAARHGNDPDDFGMNEISMIPFSTAICESCSFKVGDQFPDLSGHGLSSLYHSCQSPEATGLPFVNMDKSRDTAAHTQICPIFREILKSSRGLTDYENLEPFSSGDAQAWPSFDRSLPEVRGNVLFGIDENLGDGDAI